jgi:hypothetical protein
MEIWAGNGGSITLDDLAQALRKALSGALSAGEHGKGPEPVRAPALEDGMPILLASFAQATGVNPQGRP